MTPRCAHPPTVPTFAVHDAPTQTRPGHFFSGGAMLLAMAAALVCSPARAAVSPLDELAELSLEQLASLNVTSVSRRDEPLQEAPASIFVITGDDIRRSGATSLPEALRLAPNLMVARANGSEYAISARGFNNALGNKLLVLVDGRTVYTPLFSGVFWQAQDVMLEDVERIEVLSGPGGTLWGTNAVNGVINVITRAAGDTQGVLASVGAGNDGSLVSARYGRALEGGGHYRLYARHADRDATVRADGSALDDASRRTQAGFRADWGGLASQFSLQGDLYSGRADKSTGPDPVQVSGAHLLAHWSRTLADGSNLRIQGYYDRSHRTDPNVFAETIDTLDLEFQHGFAFSPTQQVLWGGGHRVARDRVTNSATVAFLPAKKMLRWTHLFVQDTIALRPDVNLTLGAKVETNVYTGEEFLPSLRLDWKPIERHLLWAAVSRAVRAPSRIDKDFYFSVTLPPPLPPSLLLINGGPNFVSEVSRVLELGYKAQPHAALSYSITAFRHLHDRLRSGQPSAGGFPFTVENMIEGSTTGLEAWATYQPAPRWRLSGGLVLLDHDLRLKPGSLDPTGPRALGNDPRRQWMLRSAFNLSDRHDLDLIVRRVGDLPSPAVPGYTAVDARWGWRLHRRAEISLTLRNLLDARHIEFGDPATGSYIERGAFLRLDWRL